MEDISSLGQCEGVSLEAMSAKPNDNLPLGLQ